MGTLKSRYRQEQRHCDRHGDYQSGIYDWKGDGDETSGTPCPGCQEEEQEKRQEAYRQEQRRERIEKNRKAFIQDIPLRMETETLASYKIESEAHVKVHRLAASYAEKFPSIYEQGANLILLGTVGTGKSHLAISIGHEVIRQGFSVKYTTLLGMIRSIRSTWDKGAQCSEATMLRSYHEPSLLIIDEAGCAFGSESERVLTFDVIDTRYGNKLPTIVISNLDRNGLARHLGERALDRLTELGSCVVPFNFPSYRQRRA